VGEGDVVEGGGDGVRSDIRNGVGHGVD